MPPRVVAGLAFEGHGILRKYRGGMKQGAVMFAAVEAVANADAGWAGRCHKSHVSA
jgi:hypothetical protein